MAPAAEGKLRELTARPGADQFKPLRDPALFPEYRPALLPAHGHQDGDTPHRSAVLEKHRIPASLRGIYDTALGHALPAIASVVKVCGSLTQAKNTITQRMAWPGCAGEVTVDGSGLNEGARPARNSLCRLPARLPR